MNSTKILIVDDLVESLKVMIQHLLLYNPNYNLYQSNTGAKALEIAKKVKPDLIITDWDMPGMDGIDLIRQLKANPATQNIPIIVSSGIMITAQNLKMALDAGAVDYLRKPIDPVELQARVNSALTIAMYHKKNIDAKNHELAEFALLMLKQNKFNKSIQGQVELLTRPDTEENRHRAIIDDVLAQIDDQLRLGEYEKFDLIFADVHPTFNKSLVQRFPDLTAGELRLCAFIRMGMSIKDVSALMCISPESVKVARSRLRKKLEMDNADNLESFLMGI